MRNKWLGPKRGQALALIVTMMLSLCSSGMVVYAEGISDGLCEHHTAHTAECGYVPAAEETPCNMDCTDSDGDGVIDHDSACAYSPAVPEQSCQFVCTLCSEESESTGGSEDDISVPETTVPDAVTTEAALREAISNATLNTETSVVVEGNIAITQPLVISGGQNVTLKGEGVLYPDDNFNQDTLLVVEEGGILTLDGITVNGSRTTTGISLLSGEDAKINTLIYCEGRFILSNGLLTGAHVNEDTNSGAIIVQGTSAHFIMNGGSIEKNTIDCVSRCGSVFLAMGAVFEMNNGIIRDNFCHQADYATEPATAGVMVVSELGSTPAGTSTTVRLSGGIIQNNTTKGSSHSAGGGVCLWGPDWGFWSRYARMTMEGGTIQNNTTVYGGGGVFVYGLASLDMTGGEILYNTVTDGEGGGVCAFDGLKGQPGMSDEQIANYSTSYRLGSFTLNGGTISDNQARMSQQTGDNGCGGGIYIATMNAELIQGTISNNIGERQGGGIYVGSTPYVLNMENAVITDNTASILGGGLWFCPTGDVTSVVTNGSAIYDNTAESVDTSAGDDIAIVPQGDNHYANLSVRMLGGGQVTWYRDGGVNGKSVLGMPDLTTYSRYEAGVYEEIVTEIKGKQEGIAVKCVASESAKKLAESQAALMITGNSSQRGGGIGSNGGVVIGLPDKDYNLTVIKDWGSTPEEQQAEVTINLKIGSYVLDSVKLNAENSWTAIFSGLPDPGSLSNATITVEEETLTGFLPSYSEPVIDEENRIITITVTNTPEAEPGNLMVTKVVSGSAGDRTKEWNFTVKLSDTSINGKYGDMAFTNGVAAFTLKHGQSKTAAGLPAGTGYTVTETEEDENGYTTSKTGDTGEILTNDTVEAIFTNRKSGSTPPSDPPDKPDDPDTPDTPDDPDTPDTPDDPDTSDTPDTPDDPDTSDIPDTPDDPDTPDTPDDPDMPDTPDTPDDPDAPDTSETSNDPDTPHTGDSGRTGLWVILSLIFLGGILWIKKNKQIWKK